MDAWEATKVVFDRVRVLDPDNASKIMGMLLIQHDSGKEELIIRLANGPDHLLHAFVATARADLTTTTKPAPPPSPPVGVSRLGGGGHQSPFTTDQVGHEYDGGDAFYCPEGEADDCWSPAGGGHRRRSFPPSDAEVAAWRKPCMYFARGYCKYGSSCRFLHCLSGDDAAAEREMAVMRAEALAAARSQQLTATSAIPFSPSPPKGVSLDSLLQHHQHEHQRAAAAAAAAGVLLGGEDMRRFPVRSPRMDRGELTGSPAAAQQIYLTFPADSTFSEEDVSNYFSMFGPVQDVRIPYQQKRMFGFVAFVYAETVKIILNKGNPHFVCNARVLVKPYREKGKAHERLRNLHHAHHGYFVGCTSPTGLLDSRRDPFDLRQPRIGPRMMHGNIANHEAFLRRKMEEQQQAAELQQANELEGCRFARLQLHDPKSRGHHLGSPVPLGQADGKDNINGNGNAIHMQDVTIQDSKMNTTNLATLAAAAISATDAESKHEEQQGEDGDASPKQEEKKRESGPVTATPNVACEFQESGVVEHILPESPFASPTKAYINDTSKTGQNGNISNSGPHHVAPSLFQATSTLELPPYKSCFFQVPRFSPEHEAIGL